MNTEPCCTTEIITDEAFVFIAPEEGPEFYPENRIPAMIEALYTETSLPEQEYALNTTAWD